MRIKRDRISVQRSTVPHETTGSNPPARARLKPAGSNPPARTHRVALSDSPGSGVLSVGLMPCALSVSQPAMIRMKTIAAAE